MQTFSVEVVQVELSPIAWKQCTVIWNLQTSLFQLLSNILAYKNPHVYMFFCKVLSVAFKASSTILSVSTGPLVIQIVHGRMSYDVLFLLFLPLPRPPSTPFQERHENFLSLILFHGMQIDSFALFLLAWILVQLESALNSLYYHTRKSIHYIFNVGHS